MSKIVIGESGGRNATLDLDVLLRTRLLVQANSGKGKSWLLRRLAEQMFGKVQVIIIDPEGEFATLREKYDYVLVGNGGETPAHPHSAPLLAHKLLELRASAVCDLYEMKPSQRHEWVRMFFDACIDAPKNLWHPCVFILDEAHTFVPEKGTGESEASEAAVGMSTRGRKRGFCVIPATQRLGKLRKDFAAELLNVMIGGTFIDIDRKRAADALGFYGAEQHEFFDKIKLLERGNFYALGPAISNERILLTVGPVETTHPEAGSARHAAEPPPTPEKVKSLLSKLADLPRAAEEKAKTEAELRAEIRSLKAQLRNAAAATRETKVADPQAISKAVMGATNSYRKMLADNAATLREIAASAQRIVATARVVGKEIPKKQQMHAVVTVTTGAPPKASPPPGERQLSPTISFDSPSGEALPIGEKAVLIAAAQYQEGVERDQLSVLSGYKRSSRDAYLARLKKRGLIDERGGKIISTESGIAALGSDYEPLPEGEDLQRYWLARLPEGEKKILKVLLAQNGQAIEREALDEATGYKRSSRDAYLSRLLARRIVELVSKGKVKAAEIMFE